MAGDLLVRGGTLVDGTGAPARPADVRLKDGVIAEVGPRLRPDRELLLHAGGAIVAPGVINSHTHYDPSLWWDPLVDPMPQHGVTTVVTGNCSLSLAPVRVQDQRRASGVFGFIEDIPVDAFSTGIPWLWESYSEWRDALSAHATAVNVAALVGHSNLRVYVMGDDAWERAATPHEREMLATVLSGCLAAGALGMSTSFIDQDRHGTPVPSRRADDEEMVALLKVLAAAGGGPRVLEFLPWIKDTDRWLNDIERVARWCGDRRVPYTWNQLATNSRDPSRAARVVAPAHRLSSEGCDVYAQVSPRPFNLNISFDQTPAFVAGPAWGEVIQLAIRPMCWPIGFSSTISPPEIRVEAHSHDPAGTAVLIADPTSIVGASDAGAHLRMMGGAGDTTLLLTEHVGDRGDLTIEAAVDQLTGRLGDVLGIPDRGPGGRPTLSCSRSTNLRICLTRSFVTYPVVPRASSGRPAGFGTRSWPGGSPGGRSDHGGSAGRTTDSGSARLIQAIAFSLATLRGPSA